jgi:hypothetical protein
MPDVVAAMEWAREHAPLDALHMCAGLASVRSALGHHGALADTWAWLMAFDRDDEHAAEWATAVAALLSSATALVADTTGIVDAVMVRLPVDRRRARGWLTRGAAMVPAYRGDLAPISAYADEIVAAEDDMESSIYVGFCAYMLALCGRLEECDRRVDQLRRVTRRRQARFCVDTVGNGFAADVLVSMYRGDLRGAARRAVGPVPDDPAFSMTAAAAIGQVGVLTLDSTLLEVAAGWARWGTVPILRFLPTLLDCCRALLDRDVVEAADLAERYWAEAAVVPVSRVQPLALLTIAMLAAGRTEAARAATDEAAELVAGMAEAPLLRAELHQSRAQLALHDGDPHLVTNHARELLDLATAAGFRLQVVDALELLAHVAGAHEGPESRSQLLHAARQERTSIGYRFSMLPGEARL